MIHLKASTSHGHISRFPEFDVSVGSETTPTEAIKSCAFEISLLILASDVKIGNKRGPVLQLFLHKSSVQAVSETLQQYHMQYAVVRKGNEENSQHVIDQRSSMFRDDIGNKLQFY